MKTIRSILGSVLFVAFFASLAQAQGDRTFVSGLGSDANACSRTAPCRSFAQAITQTNPGGEVVVLDSASFDAVTITQSVALVAPPGVHAGISVGSGDGILISAGASDVIILRGLTVVSLETSSDRIFGSGIVFKAGRTLHVENCVVNGFNVGFETAGLAVFGSGLVEVKDSIMRGNSIGILMKPSSGTALAAIDQVRLDGNDVAGLEARDGSRVTVRRSLASANDRGFVAHPVSGGIIRMSLEDSTASNNLLDGIQSSSLSPGSFAEIDVENCQVSNNRTGISSEVATGGVSRVRVSNSIITGNTLFGLQADGPPNSLLSRGNNTVEGNQVNTSGPIGTYTAK